MDIYTKLKINKQLSWLDLGVLSLTISGIFSILIVLMRMPHVQDLFHHKEFFSNALVAHVNLSVLFWMLCISASLWSENNKLSATTKNLSFAAIIILSVSAFFKATPYLNNYIPIIDDSYFIFSIFLFFISILAFGTYCSFQSNKFSFSSVKIITSTFMVLACLLSMLDAYHYLSTHAHTANFTRHEYFEQLVWGGGHILQYLYTQTYIAIICTLIGIRDKKFTIGLLILNTLIVLYVILNQLFMPEFYDNYILFYTDNMKYCGGIAITVLFVYIFIKLIDGKTHTPQNLRLGIILSILMFIYGGFLGFMINGANVVVPAHYHGSVVGMSILFMVYIYQKMEAPNKLANKQLLIYCIGQLMHITGLAISGGYGALRKTHTHITSPEIKMYMGIMGIGGILAIIGGFMFVVIYFKCRKSHNH